MNRRLSSSLRCRAFMWLATTACCSMAAAPLARAEVTPVPPGSTAGLQPGQPPPVAAPAPKPTTSSTLPRPAAIPATLKTATTISDVQKAQIQTYVTTSFTRLLSDDTKEWDSARADLVNGVSGPAPNTPCSAPYLAEFMPVFVQQLQQAAGKAPLAKRVNLAI